MLWKADTKTRPVILMRGKGTPWAFSDSKRWHDAGYHCLSTDYRPSPGYENDRNDGFDVIDWMIKQVWCNGQVVMFGKSKWGISQWRVAQTFHPNLIAIVPQVHGLGIFPSDNWELARGRKQNATWNHYLNMQRLTSSHRPPYEEPNFFIPK